MKNNHSIRMEDTSFEKLKELAKTQGLSIGGFCEFMIDYAAKNGINHKPEESLNSIMKKNNERLASVIKYQRYRDNDAIDNLSKSNIEIRDILLQLIKLQ